MKKEKRVKVRTRMLCVFLSAVLIPLVCFGLLMFYSSYAELEHSSIQTYTQMTAQIGAVFTEYISRADQTNRTVDKMGDIALFLRDDLTSIDTNADERYKLEQDAMSSISQLADTNTGLFSLSVVTMDGDWLSYVQEKNDIPTNSLFDSYYDVLRESTGDTVLLPVHNSQYMFSPETPVFTVALKYMDIPEGINMYTGYVISECPVDKLAEICQNVDLGSGSKLCILDQYGNVAFCDAGQEYGVELSETLASGKHQGRIRIDGRNCLLVSSELEETGWKIVATIPYTQVTEQATKLIGIFLALCILCAAIMVTAIIIQSRNFTRPIHTLQKAMKTAAGGDLTVRVVDERVDEFGDLNKGFNRLVGDLDQLINRISESKERENLAKYQMLQSQINPHFLYNTLDSIRMMAVLRDEDEIAEALISLSGLFRYCIRQGDRLVTIQEEIQQAKNYLMLQSLRYQERLKVNYQVDETVLNRMMPKVLLQPILENALIHGVQDMETGGEVTIIVSQVPEGTNFTVRDNGKGMDSVTLKRIQQKLQSGASESIGLVNVNERLRLYYNHTAGLTIESNAGMGTSVSFTIPYEQTPSPLLNYEQHIEEMRKEKKPYEQ